MEGRKAKLSQFIFTELFFDNVFDLVLSGKVTITLTFRSKTKSFLDKTLHKVIYFYNRIIVRTSWLVRRNPNALIHFSIF